MSVLYANGQGYNLCGNTAPSGYSHITWNGQYMWGYPAKVSGCGDLRFQKGGGTWYYALYTSNPNGTVSGDDGFSWTVPVGVNRVYYDCAGGNWINVNPGDVFTHYVQGTDGLESLGKLNGKTIYDVGGGHKLTIHFGAGYNY